MVLVWVRVKWQSDAGWCHVDATGCGYRLCRLSQGGVLECGIVQLLLMRDAPTVAIWLKSSYVLSVSDVRGWRWW